jgi:hypothetical protein
LDAATEQIGRLSIALVPPLGTDEHDCRHGIFSRTICLNTVAAGDPPYPSRLQGAALTTTRDVVVLVFGDRRLPRALRDLPVVGIDDVTSHGRVLVVGSDADLASVLTRLLKADRLDVEVGHVRRTWQARRFRAGQARRVPLIRDETGTVIVAAAHWLPAGEDARTIHGEAVADDTLLFDGDVTGVRIEPTETMPGLRASVLTPRMRPKRWVAGRAAQLGTDAALVVRDGVPAPRPVRRSTFYRHTQGWLQVR